MTGGYVVHDPALATLTNRYVYADLCAGQLRSFIPDRRRRDDKPSGRADGLADVVRRGLEGHVYVASLQGAVYQLVPG